MKITPIILAWAGFAVFQSSAFAQENVVLPPGAQVAGLSQADWSRAWWQWAGAFERSESPVADKNGEKCHLKQEGPVWFLAGTYGSQRTIRACKVPHDKYLFFPLINYVFMPTGEKDCNCSCNTLKNNAKAITDDPGMLILEIDGLRITNLEAHRQAPKKCFDMGARTVEKYKIYPSAANGYYVMLRPLSKGTHVLNFGGVLPNMSQAVTYTLEVE